MFRVSTWLIPVALAAALAACSTAMAQQEGLAQSDPAGVANPLAGLAQSLAEADEAFEAGNHEHLRTSLERLRASAPRPLDEAATDYLARWSEAVGGDFIPFRGRALGPGYTRGTLGPGASASINQVFLAGKSAEVALGTKARSPLRLRLYDAEGRMKCEHDPARAKTCRFTPLFTQRYRIEVRNSGRARAVYFLTID